MPRALNLHKENPLIKRLRRAHRALDNAQRLQWFSSAPELTRLKIERACQYTLEALSEYEPFWEEQRSMLQNHHLALEGDVHDGRAKDSPVFLPDTLGPWPEE